MCRCSRADCVTSLPAVPPSVLTFPLPPQALAFPDQLYEVVFDKGTVSSKTSTRLYGGALFSISLIIWNSMYTAEKVIIRWTLLTEACYLSIQLVGEFSVHYMGLQYQTWPEDRSGAVYSGFQALPGEFKGTLKSKLIHQIVHCAGSEGAVTCLSDAVLGAAVSPSFTPFLVWAPFNYLSQPIIIHTCFCIQKLNMWTHSEGRSMALGYSKVLGIQCEGVLLLPPHLAPGIIH
uniref:Tumor protein p53-inducible protein 11 n=1 Tax=Engystomops pustulosus TaxID=76066 RepID=A0AAV6YNM3_ENGPU|nr:hypothetical protein GDO81_025552 [Engystomops pustulosus]